MAFAVPLIGALAAGGGTALAGGGLGTALAVGGAALGGINSIQQGHYQARVAEMNAKIAQQNALAESEASQRNEVRAGRENAARYGEQLAAQGASGLDLLGRTQAATRSLTRRVGLEEGRDIRAQGTGAARRLLADATSFRNEGRNAVGQGYIGAAGSLLEGGRAVAKDTGITRSLVSKKRRRF